jgi:hypothetical protein
VFTPHNVALVRQLARDGKSSKEIANVIGSTPASIKTKCYMLGIPLGRKRPDGTYAIRGMKLVGYVSRAAKQKFSERATVMGISDAMLVMTMLLEAIADGATLFDAVLDQ